MKRRLLVLIAVCLVALGALIDHVVSAGSTTPSTAAAAITSQSTTRAPSVSSIDAVLELAYARASQSVVYISSAGVGTGSGVLYDANGDIVTNNHVIDGASSITVTLNDKRTFTAQVVGTDRADDLAVIRIQASGLTPLRFAGAGGYKVAQTVLAIGSPLGLKQSVTSGLISGLHRVEQEPNGSYLSDAIQTSAPINPGNSGGALVALDGTVVGIPTLEQTNSVSGSSTQNIGFAIPSERVVAMTDQIIAHGKVQHTGRPYLGIAPRDASNLQGSSFGFDPGQTAPSTSGALVSQISASGPAAQAGVQQGDVITGADGVTITDAQELLTVVAGKKPGDTITLKVSRNGTNLTLQVHLGELPA